MRPVPETYEPTHTFPTDSIPYFEKVVELTNGTGVPIEDKGSSYYVELRAYSYYDPSNDCGTDTYLVLDDASNHMDWPVEYRADDGSIKSGRFYLPKTATVLQEAFHLSNPITIYNGTGSKTLFRGVKIRNKVGDLISPVNLTLWLRIYTRKPVTRIV